MLFGNGIATQIHSYLGECLRLAKATISSFTLVLLKDGRWNCFIPLVAFWFEIIVENQHLLLPNVPRSAENTKLTVEKRTALMYTLCP